ncbi:hypothetical protein GMYAFLOJ_CDS0050 [Microbacterium phage phiMiGM15]
MTRRFHRYVLGHIQGRRKVDVSSLEPFRRGVFIRCECGKTWAV